ncbi:37S ribosomal protein S25 [Microdochium bolleyi]|uniref:37S ribosomal protein S25, mitochondrial n=1 Tax=Microdochium bolleyi TaxID=196109 RepID=A0A136IPR5_9PEZI|nr:37S ribosomal protein S25 [Microdochium bolleyi]
MGGMRQTAPPRVFQTATAVLNQAVIGKVATQKPVWYDIMAAHPPGEILTRTYPQQHRPQKITSKTRKASKLFQPQKLTYEEDILRRQFYKDHPWELARPRMIVETDGKDAQKYDWSRGLRQPGMQLSGESVVQRQLWMMYNIPGMTRVKAYDAARREFYQLRQEEDVERRIAAEEARAVGAYFGKGFLQIGLELEDREFESWKKWAGKQIEIVRTEQTSAYTSFGEEDAVEDAADADPAEEEAK